MSVIDQLMETAEADVQVLEALDRNGDDFSITREVDFFLKAPSREKAELVAGFVNDYQYGRATAHSEGDEHSVTVLVEMPVLQHALHAVSGFMVCLCALYGLEYDGWGCTAQVQREA